MKKLRQLTPLLYGFRQAEFRGVEARLQASLDPVTPSPEFVGRLKEQLLDQWGTLSHLPNVNTPAGILLILVGILSGFLFVIVTIRAILILIGLISIYRGVRGKQMVTKKDLPSI